MSDFSQVCFTCRNDACRLLTWGINDQEHALFNPAYDLVAIFAIAVPVIGMDDPVRIEKRLRGLGKIKATLSEAGFAFSFIPFKIHI